MFRFKQFAVADDRSSMKVGTDAVLLGAWAQLPPTGHILEVGCGSGVVALMLAQRAPQAQILGIDIDEPSVEQATDNAANSPFRNVAFSVADFLAYEPPFRVDAVVSNPPYHTETLLSPKESRAKSRSSFFLPYDSFVHRADSFLADGGTLQVVLPAWSETAFHEECNRRGLTLTRITRVKTTDAKPPRRVLMEFRKGEAASIERSEITLLNNDGTRSKTYAKLCKDYYL